MSKYKPKISILLPAFKSGDLLKKVFFPGFLKNSTVISELIIYDNGGNESDFEQPYEFNAYTMIGNGTNVGLNRALNACARLATGDWFYLPHTDMYLMPKWDTALLEASKNQAPSSVLLCSRSIEPTRGHTDFHIIKDYGKEWHDFEEERLLQEFENYRDTSVVTGYRMPFFLHRSLWEKMGGVDESLWSYGTDDDLVQTAYDRRVRKFWLVNDSLVYHLQGKSNQQQTVDRDSQAPYVYFTEKWRKRGYADARHPGQWHPQLIPNYLKVK